MRLPVLVLRSFDAVTVPASLRRVTPARAFSAISAAGVTPRRFSAARYWSSGWAERWKPIASASKPSLSSIGHSPASGRRSIGGPCSTAPNSAIWLVERSSAADCARRSTVSAPATTRARFGSSASKAPALARFSICILLSSFGSTASAKSASEAKRPPCRSRQATRSLIAWRPTRFTAASAKRIAGLPPCSSTANSAPEALMSGGRTLMPSRDASCMCDASLSVLSRSSDMDAARNATGWFALRYAVW